MTSLKSYAQSLEFSDLGLSTIAWNWPSPATAIQGLLALTPESPCTAYDCLVNAEYTNTSSILSASKPELAAGKMLLLLEQQRRETALWTCVLLCWKQECAWWQQRWNLEVWIFQMQKRCRKVRGWLLKRLASHRYSSQWLGSQIQHPSPSRWQWSRAQAWQGQSGSKQTVWCKIPPRQLAKRRHRLNHKYEIENLDQTQELFRFWTRVPVEQQAHPA